VAPGTKNVSISGSQNQPFAQRIVTPTSDQLTLTVQAQNVAAGSTNTPAQARARITLTVGAPTPYSLEHVLDCGGGNAITAVLTGVFSRSCPGNGRSTIDGVLGPGTYTLEVTMNTTGGGITVGALTLTLTPSIATPTTLVASLLPSSRAVLVGTPATFFAAIVNSGTNPALQVGIALASIQSQALLTFNATDCATNAVTGGDNVRVDIAPGDQACFVVTLTPTQAFGPVEVSFSFAGLNTAPVATLVGLNTLQLLASTTPVPDIVALAATTSGDGIVTLPGPSGSGAFSVATFNVGAPGSIDATANTHGVGLPLTLLICESNPVTAACLGGPAPGVTTQMNSGQASTFSIFVFGSGSVAFDPANHRIFVEFRFGGVVVGRTSVAVRTQ